MPVSDAPPPELAIRLRLPVIAWAAVPMVAMWFAALVLLMSIGPPLWLRTVAAFVGVGALNAYLLIRSFGVRDLVFGAGLTVRYHLGRPDRHIPYEDITDLGVRRLVARSARVQWGGYANADEVDEAIAARLHSGQIRADRLAGVARVSDRARLKAGVLSNWMWMTITAVHWLVALSRSPAGVVPSMMSSTLIGMSCGLVVFGGAFLVFRRRFAAEPAVLGA